MYVHTDRWNCLNSSFNYRDSGNRECGQREAARRPRWQEHPVQKRLGSALTSSTSPSASLGPEPSSNEARGSLKGWREGE